MDLEVKMSTARSGLDGANRFITHDTIILDAKLKGK